MHPPVIYLRAEAPAKPATGAPCNGCGLCCAWQPCPLGVLVSGRRHGACDALRWDTASRIYRCAMVDAPQQVWPTLPRWLQPVLQGLARRWIASGAGCDCDAEVDLALTSSPPALGRADPHPHARSAFADPRDIPRDPAACP